MTAPLIWPAGSPVVRAHSHAFGSTELDARVDVDARFSPLHLDSATPTAVLYAGTEDATAAAETIFHRLPGGDRPRRVWLNRYRAWHWSRIAPVRDLRLLPIDARTPGADALVDGDAPTYPAAREAAAALLVADPDADGLLWASRQLYDRPSTVTVEPITPHLSLLLVGRTVSRPGGVTRHELAVDDPVVPFASTAGLERLDDIANGLGITIVRS